MATIQIELTSSLAQKIQEKAAAPEALNKVVTEAIEQWLERQEEELSEKDRTMQVLLDAGLVMSPEAQRAMAEALMVGLPKPTEADRSRVEAALSKLKVPLSEEILLMRGER